MKTTILDHGYVEFIEAWGTGKDGKQWDHPEHPNRYDAEIGIIEAARQSTQGSFRGWARDEKLLKFLYDNNHATPFEFSGMVIEVQAPIFVFREWQRHRAQSYNEMSARYAPLPNLNYIPTVERCLAGGQHVTSNKQAQAVVGAQPLTERMTELWLKRLQYAYELAESVYQDGLAIRIPKELARCPMPVARYSKMRVSANLRNWLAFLTLRMDPHAQWEIRQFANAVGDLIAENFPHTWKLFASRAG